MEMSLTSLVAHARTPEGQKKIRFASVSAIAILISLVTLAICYGPIGWDEHQSLISQGVAFVVSTIGAYFLNRRWVWGRTGRSSFWKEVAPFWGIGIVQLIISVPFVQWGRTVAERHFESRVTRTVLFLILNLFVYGVMWVGKYLFYNKVLFADRNEAGSVA